MPAANCSEFSAAWRQRETLRSKGACAIRDRSGGAWTALASRRHTGRDWGTVGNSANRSREGNLVDLVNYYEIHFPAWLVNLPLRFPKIPFTLSAGSTASIHGRLGSCRSIY